MKRWDFFSGLTIILCLLMILGGFCIWTTQKQTSDLKEQIASNYDTMHALREMRTASTRINAVALIENDPLVLKSQTNTYAHERGLIMEELVVVTRAISEPGEAELVNRLKALLGDYLDGLDELYSDTPIDRDHFENQQLHLGRKAGEIAEVVSQIVKVNEEAIFVRRDRAVARGQQATYIALGLVFVSLAIYIYTSFRLTQGVFQPLIRLRDSIVNLRESRFTQFVPLEGGAEIGQIAANFNRMAADLRAFIDEKDDRVVAANRLSRAILQALPKPVYIVDNDLQVTLMNPRAEILSSGVGVPGSLPSQVRQRVDEASAAGHDLIGDDIRNAIEMEYLDENNGVRKASFIPQVFRMKSELGVPEGWAVLLVDVTNLRRLDAAKTKAISTLGHEVKTPVTGIRMTLHLLLEEKLGKLTPDQRELLESGRDDCERLLVVLQALLELARLESGRASLNIQSVQAASLLQQADAMQGTLMRQSGHELIIETPNADVPPVQADLMHSGRVLGNFLSNALKYGLPGEPVTLRAVARADGYVRFSVINHSAVQLTETEQARVFEPFYRRPGEQAEGSGLGLTIAREIAGLQAGRIGVWSQDGTVEFYLDLKITQK
jgi:two-component system, NtrC family, sensor histidine kinase KinB